MKTQSKALQTRVMLLLALYMCMSLHHDPFQIEELEMENQRIKMENERKTQDQKRLVSGYIYMCMYMYILEFFIITNTCCSPRCTRNNVAHFDLT